MDKLYDCTFIYCANFLDKEQREYFIEDTLRNIKVEADNLANLLFGLIEYTNDYVQDNYLKKEFRKNIRPIDDENKADIITSNLKIKGIRLEQVIDLIEFA